MFVTLKRTAKMFRTSTAAEREMSYLNEATDRYDLEARERDVARGAFRNRVIGF